MCTLVPYKAPGTLQMGYSSIIALAPKQSHEIDFIIIIVC